MTKAPPRPSMSAARRARLFARDGGICSLCKSKVQTGEPYEIDHIQAWALTFNDDDSNLTTVHKSCHRDQKTGGDVTIIAKAKAQGGETGQWARRQKRGHGLIQSRGFDKNRPKTSWPKRPFDKRPKGERP